MNPNTDALSIVDEGLVLRADPRGAEPSEVEGVSRAELLEMQDNIRWFGRLTIAQKLEAGRRARRWQRHWQRSQPGAEQPGIASAETNDDGG